MSVAARVLVLVATALPAVLPLQATAACPSHSKVIFSCVIGSNSKHVDVCDLGATITYSYGRPGHKPELAFARPRDQVTTYQWHGGGSENYAVTLINENATYSVFTDAVTSDGQAGINVETAKHIVQLYCDLDSLEQHLEGIDLKEAE
jgi:hypothetical protein